MIVSSINRATKQVKGVIDRRDRVAPEASLAELEVLAAQAGLSQGTQISGLLAQIMAAAPGGPNGGSGKSWEYVAACACYPQDIEITAPLTPRSLITLTNTVNVPNLVIAKHYPVTGGNRKPLAFGGDVAWNNSATRLVFPSSGFSAMLDDELYAEMRKATASKKGNVHSDGQFPALANDALMQLTAPANNKFMVPARLRAVFISSNASINYGNPTMNKGVPPLRQPGNIKSIAAAVVRELGDPNINAYMVTRTLSCYYTVMRNPVPPTTSYAASWSKSYQTSGSLLDQIIEDGIFIGTSADAAKLAARLKADGSKFITHNNSAVSHRYGQTGKPAGSDGLGQPMWMHEKICPKLVKTVDFVKLS